MASWKRTDQIKAINNIVKKKTRGKSLVDEEKVDLFATHIRSLCENRLITSKPEKPLIEKLSDRTNDLISIFDENILIEYINYFPRKKAPGPSGITNEVLIVAKEQIFKFLAPFF